jgi:hypothetical protein
MCALRLSWPTGLAALSLIVFHKHRSTENNHFYTIEDVRNLVCGLAIDKSLDPSVTHACSAHKSNSYATSRLEESLERIKHRGPDAQSTWTSNDKRVGMFKL